MAPTPLLHEAALVEVTNRHHDAIHKVFFSVFILLLNSEIAMDPCGPLFFFFFFFKTSVLPPFSWAVPCQSLFPALVSLPSFQMLGSLVLIPPLFSLYNLSQVILLILMTWYDIYVFSFPNG